ncbi:hypothetical protein CKAH01_10970 [Colletotrichum kahawae]|uniref:Uncharacterized protein n=1 Tax=Colletotrichum kahawae TaxID=34407 RepID=A0AAD9XW75_COLKA|nr:hypothetical protein CKAH01_10970 [Colletotrichum kahawae]
MGLHRGIKPTVLPRLLAPNRAVSHSEEPSISASGLRGITRPPARTIRRPNFPGSLKDHDIAADRKKAHKLLKLGPVNCAAASIEASRFATATFHGKSVAGVTPNLGGMAAPRKAGERGT